MGETTRSRTLSESTLAALAKRCCDADPRPWDRLDLADPAQRAFGDYELLEKLGEGGMGVVFRAHQQSLQRDVAIKFIAGNLVADAEMVRRFRSEAQAAARLHHPHIVPVFEVGLVENLHFFTMPLLRGRTLADPVIASGMAIGECVALMRKLASAVAHAHSLGLLHLDLKPANIMFDEHGEPLIGDFGLARQLDEKGGVDAQEVSGTPAYMAPEQIQIKRFRLSPATDVYALGAILYWLLTGTSPHGRGSSAELMDNASAGRVVPLRERRPGVARDLAAICDHCLALRADERYPSATELLRDLSRFAAGEAISVRAPGVLERSQRWIRRRPRLAASLATAGVLLVLVGLAGSWWLGALKLESERVRYAAVMETVEFMKKPKPVQIYRQEGRCYSERKRLYGTVFVADPTSEIPCPEGNGADPEPAAPGPVQ